MTLYRLQTHLNRMQRFRSIAFNEHYREKDLETWLEQNPTVVTDGEPILLIARQPPTPASGTPDLIGLDADGNTVIIELKQGRTPRDVLAQALEYAAWVAGLSETELADLAAGYLSRQAPPLSLGEAWRQAFEPDSPTAGEGVATLPDGVQLNGRQRIILIIEGVDERLEAVVRYLAHQGLDVNLLSYRFYKIEGGEEILALEETVSHEQVAAPPAALRWTRSCVAGPRKAARSTRPSTTICWRKNLPWP